MHGAPQSDTVIRISIWKHPVMVIHLQTLLLVAALVTVCSTASMVLLLVEHRDEPGIRFLALGLGFQGTGILIQAFSSSLPPLCHAVVGNTLFPAAVLGQLLGVRMLFRRAVPAWSLPLALLGLAVFFGFLTFGVDSLRFRMVALGMLTGIGSLAITLELGRKGQDEIWPGPRLLCMGVYALHAFTGLGWAGASLGSVDPRMEVLGLTSLNALYLFATLLVAVFTSFGFALLVGQRLLVRQRQLALTDLLTGLPNRRGFMEQVSRAFQRAKGSREPLGLLVMDLDHFKQINDRFGHAAGDAALVTFSQRVLASLRESDVAGRIGGEEFAVLLRWANLVDAMHVAERIRRSVCADPVESGRHSITMTVSIGVACSQEGAPDLSAFFRLADRRLYQAKGEGRDQIIGVGLETHTGAVLA